MAPLRPALLRAALTLACLGAAACSGPAPTVPPNPPPATPATTPSTASPAAAKPTFPLTGEPATTAAEQEAAGRVAVLVKVENSREARPQAGLGQADWLFEELVEGGETRFAVVYQTQVPDRVGPVRSVRPVDSAIAAPLGALALYSGGTKPFVAMLDASGAQDLSAIEAEQLYYRDHGRPAPHNLYLRGAKVRVEANPQHHAPPSPGGWRFGEPSAAQAATSRPVSRATLTYSGYFTAGFVAGGTATNPQWRRLQDGKPMLTEDGKGLSFSNVVICAVKVKDSHYTDAAGSPVPITTFTGSGTVWVLRGHSLVKGAWAKSSEHAPLTLTLADGSPMSLQPGHTMFELLPSTVAPVFR